MPPLWGGGPSVFTAHPLALSLAYFIHLGPGAPVPGLGICPRPATGHRMRASPCQAGELGFAQQQHECPYGKKTAPWAGARGCPAWTPACRLIAVNQVYGTSSLESGEKSVTFKWVLGPTGDTSSDWRVTLAKTAPSVPSPPAVTFILPHQQQILFLPPFPSLYPPEHVVVPFSHFGSGLGGLFQFTLETFIVFSSNVTF